MMRKCIRARYSPMTPKVMSCTPENKAMVDARNANPGTEVPANTALPTTHTNRQSPKNAVKKPKVRAAWSGAVLYPVMVSVAKRRSFRRLKCDVPSWRGACSTSTLIDRVVDHERRASSETDGPSSALNPSRRAVLNALKELLLRTLSAFKIDPMNRLIQLDAHRRHQD